MKEQISWQKPDKDLHEPLVIHDVLVVLLPVDWLALIGTVKSRSKLFISSATYSNPQHAEILSITDHCWYCSTRSIALVLWDLAFRG